MDKNSIFGLTLIMAILVGYHFLTRPSEEERKRMFEEQKRRNDSLELVEENKQADKKIKNNPFVKEIAPVDTLVNTDSLQLAKLTDSYGTFANAADGEEKFVSLENDLIDLKITTKGGRVYSSTLKDFKRFDSTDVVLFDGEKNKFEMLFTAQNRNLTTGDLFFEVQNSSDKIDASKSKQALKLRAKISDTQYIEYIYSLSPKSHMVGFDINIVGLNDIINKGDDVLEFNWEVDAPKQEKGRQWENDNTGIYFFDPEEGIDYLSERSEKEHEEIKTKTKWVAFKQQFFSSVFIAHNTFVDAVLEQEKLADEEYLKHFKADLSIPYEGKESENAKFSFYFGPNKYSLLKKIQIDDKSDLELQELVPLGWGIFGWVNRIAIIPLFNGLGLFISNYGLLILVMTIIIKLVLFPLTYKSYLSTARMRVLKPQIEEINNRIPKDKAMERQQATMALYKKVGVNPMGGCLPMFLQMPILFAMFKFFPSSIELRQKGFLWADDLSTYDSVFDLPFEIPFYGDHVSLFCLLMAGSMILSTKMSSAQMDTGSSQMPGMKSMMYIMPLMMLFWFNSYSSGLSFYYLVANLITYGQTMAIRSFVDEKEILKKLDSNKKKPVKKSKFQQRLEEMAKQKGYKPPK